MRIVCPLLAGAVVWLGFAQTPPEEGTDPALTSEAEVQLLQQKYHLESEAANSPPVSSARTEQNALACTGGYGPGRHVVQLPQIKRQFLLVVPPELVAAPKGVPALMSFHGTYESPWFHERDMKLSQELAHYGWLGILPFGSRPGEDSSMNGIRQCCAEACTDDQCCMEGLYVANQERPCSFLPPHFHEDELMVDVIFKWLEEHTCVDRSKVFTAGMSFGGTISWRLACSRSHLFRAAAPVDATFISVEDFSCPELRPLSIYSIGGTGDPLMGSSELDLGAKFFADRFNCQAHEFEALSASVNCTRWSTCAGGHVIENCWVDGMPHIIPGHLKPDDSTFIRPGSDIDWTKRTFEKFSLLVDHESILFYGHPTDAESEWKGGFWPPPKLHDHEYLRHPTAWP
mmetsp:Transcript_11346/g.21415  ORF Transcript_11346/g.21415 Transcript_11346/m.21415 type:complete len:401 (-) Transcript_11346:20-1222(-)